ncbi:MAG TPA: hypothetical protein VN132_00240 [Bdellovibrio sp.]|nr:hypothetical protein [Bdellovibrio sp.]
MTWHNTKEIEWHTIMEIGWHSIQEIEWHKLVEIRHLRCKTKDHQPKNMLTYFFS